MVGEVVCKGKGPNGALVARRPLPGSEAVWGNSGGVARCLAQPPANRWDPSGIGDDGWICRWVSERGWRVVGVAGVTGLSEPGDNGGGAQGAGRRWGRLNSSFICFGIGKGIC